MMMGRVDALSTGESRPSWPGILATWLAILLIRCYQCSLRPLLVGTCKFYPTCSEYTAEAIARHGLPKGTWLGLRRICRCHPFRRGGLDPVP